MSILLLIIGLVLFVGLVVVHEFGHFLAARQAGVEVEEFGIGFPPKAWSRRLKNGMRFSLNWLPLGGFVKLKGENDSATDPGTFGATSTKNKIKIMLAGVAMNTVVAFGLLTILALIGMPRLFENQFTVANDTKVVKNNVLVGYVEPGSPAAKAGLKPNDQLLRASSIACMTHSGSLCHEIKSGQDLRTLTEGFASLPLDIEYKRDGQLFRTQAQLRSSEEVEKSKGTADPKGYLGVAPTEYTLRRSTWSAPVVAAGVIGQFTELTFKGLATALAGLFTGHGSQAAQQVSGPVGIFVLLKDGSLLGYQFILMVIAVISLTLAIMNVLPIPALDGGRLFVMLLYRARHKPLSKRREELIHGSGFAVLMLLFVVITIIDIRRFF